MMNWPAQFEVLEDFSRQWPIATTDIGESEQTSNKNKGSLAALLNRRGVAFHSNVTIA